MSVLSILSEAAQLAEALGLFSWQIQTGKYINPDGIPITFHNMGLSDQIPLANMLSGATNAYSLVAPTDITQPVDANANLFNTKLASARIVESINRKVAINKIPFASYDQLVDLGVGGQDITISIMFWGTEYLTAFYNFVQVVNYSLGGGMGELIHPFYGKIKNVLPIAMQVTHQSDRLMFVACEWTVRTTDLNHLYSTPPTSLTQTISKYASVALGLASALSSLSNLPKAI